MKTNRENTTTTTANRDYYAEAEKAVYIALRARHEKSALNLFADLQNAQHRDTNARSAPRICEEISDLETIYKSTREAVEFFSARAKRLTLTNWEREEAQALAREYSAEATRTVKRINDLYDALNISYSDRADLIQTAIEQMLINEQTPAKISAKVLASYGVTDPADLDPAELEEAQTRANFRAVINAVGRGIGELATPDALYTHKTKRRPATPEEVEGWIIRYGGTGSDVRVYVSAKRMRMSDCYYTMEARKTAHYCGNWYLITHYITPAPYRYIESYADGENAETDPAYLKSYNPFVDDYGDIERIEEFSTRAELNEREREWLTAYATACRYTADPAEARAFAYDSIKLSGAEAQKSFFRRLKNKLRK